MGVGEQGMRWKDHSVPVGSGSYEYYFLLFHYGHSDAVWIYTIQVLTCVGFWLQDWAFDLVTLFPG